MRLSFRCALLFVAAALFVLPAAAGEGSFHYENVHPSAHAMTAEQINAAIIGEDLTAQRAHAWALWTAMTATAQSRYRGQAIPVWQTWYSDEETFGANASVAQPLERDACCTFEEPVQSEIAHEAFGGKPTPVLAFVRYNRPAHEFIVHNAYNRKATLSAIAAAYDESDRPVQLRTLKPFPREAIVLKATFQFIKAHGLTGVPYYDPSYPPPSGGRVPVHLYWRDCVAVDPTKQFPDGLVVRVLCNGRTVDAPVIHLDRFEALHLTGAADVATARLFAKRISMETAQEHMVTGELTPQVGDWLMLSAMHVMTREIDTWTFQTFWWTPNASEAPFGADRPASVRGPWRNYVMCTAYNEDLPRTAAGGPHICFNPYLESDLGPTKPYVFEGRSYPADPMAGTRSNCMACHARAGWPAKLKPPYTTAANIGRIFNPGYTPRTAPYYRHIVTTDMLWSIPSQSK